MPRFEKTIDDRLQPETWPVFDTPVNVVLFEGWCVGAIAQMNEDLAQPVNDLERQDDPVGIWRLYVTILWPSLISGYSRQSTRSSCWQPPISRSLRLGAPSKK